MKKIFVILILLGLLTGCYDEFVVDYPYTTVAFSEATGGLTTWGELGLSVVKDEGLKLDVGVFIAGVLENKVDRTVDFVIDEELLNGTGYELMPADYYSLSNTSKFTIPAGEFVGKLTVTLDSAKFLGDTLCAEYHYAIPIRLTSTSADSVNSTHNTKIVVVKYINHYEGYYDQAGSFVTYDENGLEINSGTIGNVLLGSTFLVDTVSFNGAVYSIGDDYQMKAVVKTDNTVYLEKVPVTSEPITVPYNLAYESVLSTDYCSGWENIEGVRDDILPVDSHTRNGPIFGNWNSYDDWGYLQYEFPGPREISSAEIYWFTDFGGLQFPDETSIQYRDLVTGEWVDVSNPDALGHDADVMNVTNFDPVTTYAIRYNFISHAGSIGVAEFRAFGIPKTVYPEQAIMESITSNGSNTYDPATSTYTLHYRVTYKAETFYTDVTTVLVWRNRIRDGVNEWRR